MVLIRFLPCLLTAKSAWAFHVHMMCNLKVIACFPMELMKIFQGDIEHHKLALKKKLRKPKVDQFGGR